METVTSRDGTTIAFHRTGDGPAVVLVTGALGTRGSGPGELEVLLAAAGFKVFGYDRRGRGDSGDTPPYAVEREVEDLEAVIGAAGGTAYVYGMSSGGQLALRSARTLPQIHKLAVYEPPIIVDDSREPLPPDYVERLDGASPGEALTIFMTDAIGLPGPILDQMRGGPIWPALEGVAHTLAYDGRVVGDSMSGHPLGAEWGDVAAPVLVVTGGASERFMRDGGDALAALLPNATCEVIDGQDHNVDPKLLAPLLIDFFRR
ncbi:MAG TPA: alpha/beta hydrolase [Actinoplanes sp.]|jgi:pimeloyl-ACP methyl ester carboxylesterase